MYALNFIVFYVLQIVGDPQSSMPFNPLLVEKRKTYAKCLMENEVLIHRKGTDEFLRSSCVSL